MGAELEKRINHCIPDVPNAVQLNAPLYYEIKKILPSIYIVNIGIFLMLCLLGCHDISEV